VQLLVVLPMKKILNHGTILPPFDANNAKFSAAKKAACVPPTILALSSTLPPSNAESDVERIS
jgi:hypothetical protein